VTDELEIRKSSTLGRGQRAKLFTSAYEGYLLPFQVDEAALAMMEKVFDLDPDASRIALHEGETVGLGNLGVRGEDAWIGGVGVVPAARRSGVGEALMRALHDQARERGVRRVWLEVIVENEAAFALYEKLGYRTVRDVEVWSLPEAEEGDSPLPGVPAVQARARIRELRSGREPWQRADRTVENYGDARGLELDEGAALFRGATAIQLLQIAGDAEQLLRSLRRLGQVSVLNLPEEDPAANALRKLGAALVVRQHEMLLELGH
jgi:ribosomal protein S18 acetylase RimI-like enzyme